MYVAKHMHITIDRIDFEVEGVRDQAGALHLPIQETPAVASRLQRIYGTAKVHTEATQEQVDELEEQVKRRCPIANMVVLSGCELDIKWMKAMHKEDIS